MVISTRLADLPVRIRVCHENTASLFAPYTVADSEEHYDMAVRETDAVLTQLRPADDANEWFREHTLLILAASRFLLPRGGVVIHGVALSVLARGWLLTGKSGVGKTTQYNHLQALFPAATEIICGDKPILRRIEDGSFRLYPSPWLGKEGYTGERSAPLAGIVLLSQAEENRLAVLTPSEAAFSLYSQLLYSPDTEADARSAAALESALLNAVPVYRFDNRGDEASARMLIEVLRKEGLGDESV